MAAPAAWTPCNSCGNFWCNIHDRHAFECDCPPLEHWTTDPYTQPDGPPPMCKICEDPRRLELLEQLLAAIESDDDQALAESVAAFVDDLGG